MTDEQKVLVESQLVKAISTFHDCDDKEKRERYVKEYFWEFCEKYSIDPKEAFGEIEKFLADRGENSIFKYEYYDDIKSIIFSDEQDEKQQAPNLDDDGR